jgi:hypothetical protein
MKAQFAEQAEAMRKGAAEQATIQREAATRQKEAAAQRRELQSGIGAGVGGIGGMIVGGATLEGIKEAAGLGATVDSRIAQLKSMGVSGAQIEASRAQFREFSKTHAGILEQDWLKARGEASTVAPGDEAEMTELAARYRTAARASGTPLGENDFLATMRAMDEMGIRTPEKREEFLNNMLKMQQKFQGTVTPETYLSAVQNLRSAKFSLDDDFIKNYFPTLIQATGEQGGTEVMTAFNNYIGGHMQHSELKKLAAAGFARNEDLDFLKNGEIKGLKPGAKLFEESTFEKNPFQWSNDFHAEFMKRQGATEEEFEKLVMSMPRNMGAMIMEFVKNQQRYERDARNNKQEGLAASDNASLAKNPGAAFDALKTSVEQLATSIAGPTVQALGPALAGMAQGVQSAASYLGGLNQNAVALGGGLAALVGTVGGLKLLFGSLTGGFGLGKSAGLLDQSAEQLMSAAQMLKGENALGGHGPGRSPSTPSLRGRAGLAAGSAVGALSMAPADDAAINEALNDNSKSIVGQAVAASVDALKAVANDISAALHGGVEIRRGNSGPHPAPGPHGTIDMAAKLDTSAINAAFDALGRTHPVVTVGVDLSAFEGALARIRSGLASLGALSGTGGLTPSLDSTIRNGFSYGGIRGE